MKEHELVSLARDLDRPGHSARLIADQHHALHERGRGTIHGERVARWEPLQGRRDRGRQALIFGIDADEQGWWT
ncbi:MAG: hypothetical protein ACR2NV_03265 [Thermoleophilaceae bacterium]